ncbi:MarR family transcriptional regulator [Sneathiella sp. P13V-1]|uniref:MarR family winged helix-turn-helix transcriptional regulator n=1 Tax=Sneathiella sp. P13V-1 TaxID=2697366 RepID=UPI00187B7569|nr:MarR family transcriptional regulator [Sneathiella sp. P13V-1]MBE7638020.1 MarR family transcriptional regulator [Sneathiella sp. P13V-1]
MHTLKGAAFTELVLEIFRINGILLAEGDRLSEDLGLSSSRWQVMGAIADEPLAVPHIAKEMGLTRQGVQKTINILVKEGLVDLIDNPRHKSSKLASLTEEGRKRFSEIHKIQAVWANDIAGGQELPSLEATLQTIRNLRESLERK